MEELIKNIKEMGMDWFIETLRVWPDVTDLDNIDEVAEDLNDFLIEEMSIANQ